MRRVLKVLTIILVFIFLTVLTQVGGIIYLLALISFPFINRKFNNWFVRNAIKLGTFLMLYTIITFTIVPLIAKRYNRVPLPITTTNHLKPLNILTAIFNRNYVQPELVTVAMNAALEVNKNYPGTVVNYLDAGFPLFHKYPLLPHLSHNDGKKLDIAFMYLDKTGTQTNNTPSSIGYGDVEEPKPFEVNQPFLCDQKGYWQYSLLQKIVPTGNRDDFSLDEDRTSFLCNVLTDDPKVSKLFIEPHLKTRMKLSSSKIRFHGCQAVRHDDHVHVQMF